MSVLVWDEVGKRLYETGVNKAVLYPKSEAGYEAGVAWSGMTALNESPSGAEASPLYADNIKYLNLMSAEEFGATIEAYYYPDEFEECDGSKEIAPGVSVGQQTRKHFGLSYQTKIGNDEVGTNHGYKIHIIYDCLASPSEKSYSSINDNPEANNLSWTVSTTPVNVPGGEPSATLVIDSTKISKENLKKLEDMLYGTETEDATLPTPAEIIALVGVAATQE